MELLARIRPEDLPFEEDLLRNAFNLKAWLRYIERTSNTQRPHEFIYFLYERAIQELPGSYKLWKRYLDARRLTVEKNPQSTDQDWRSLNQCYERALVFMHKMPRIWLDYCDLLAKQNLLTFTRRAYDRALRSLPVTQHPRVWEGYLKFAANCGVFQCTRRIYQRYLKVKIIKVVIIITIMYKHRYLLLNGKIMWNCW
jgi:pre-mRNA-splicing factor SYF1